ncbi:hypothetical protein [Flavobacterium sp. H4147]|uniref:hypothetical protein n=1 Tax=Flavobacterium sp. H4147 TaxID=3034149 RepID=UPI0023EBF265|nr:hypothetical protein [Flavobacterium sp. H4147]
MLVSYFVVISNVVSYQYFIETNFLFTFLGVFIGFALTLYTYLTSMFENMKKIIRTKHSEDVKTRDEKLKLLPLLHLEIKENIIFLIYALVFVVLVAVLNEAIMSIDLCTLNIEISDIKNASMLTVFILSILSLIDLVQTSFTISDFIIKN